MTEVVVCRTGMARHAPDLPGRLHGSEVTLSTVECFDRCDTCERALIARIDGATTRFRDGDELLAALAALRSEE
ncbi:MAG: hypothetical protein ACK4YP_23030 [Myxococcota bacterium]